MSTSPSRENHSRTVRLQVAGDGFEAMPSDGHFLVGVNADAAVIAHEIPSDDRLILGRSSSATVRVTDPGASSVHAAVSMIGPKVVVEDLNSTNGTFVDSRRIQVPTELRVGARLQIGRVVFRHELRSRSEIARRVQVDADLDAARRYVEALLPAPRTTGPVRTDWTFVPCAALAGDAFGIIDLEGGSVAFFMLDVVGHGARSALHSVSAVNVLRNRSLSHAEFKDPVSVLTALNDAFPMDQHDGLFFTLWYGVYEPIGRRLRYGVAGHPGALLLSEDDRPTRVLKTPGPPIGTFENARFAADELTLEPHSRLVLFTDGVYEIAAAPGREWSRETFVQAVEATRTSDITGASRRLLEQVIAAAADERLDDDFSLLIAEFVD